MVIDLARGMAASAEGLTLNEMAGQLRVGRRTAERMRDAVLMLFPQVVLHDDAALAGQAGSEAGMKSEDVSNLLDQIE